METKAEGQVWTPALQDFQPSTMTFYIRTATAPEKMAPLARRTVAQIDPEVPLYNVKTMQAQINETHFIDRLLSMLSAAFGALATLLAAIGLYGSWPLLSRAGQLNLAFGWLWEHRGGTYFHW